MVSCRIFVVVYVSSNAEDYFIVKNWTYLRTILCTYLRSGTTFVILSSFAHTLSWRIRQCDIRSRSVVFFKSSVRSEDTKMFLPALRDAPASLVHPVSV
jgi:hypothetical protein